jgi:protein O-GlcNAc transferase
MTDKLFEDASRLQAAGNLAEAARLYSDVLRGNPRHFEALFRLGAIHNSIGRFADAEYLFSTAIKVNPQAPEALYSLGCALQNLKRHEDALVYFARALALQPGYIEARNNRGVSLLELRRYEEALACFDRVLSERPNEAIVHGNHASALSALKRHDEALISADRALRLSPGIAIAWQQKAIALIGLGRFEEATSAFDRALAIQPGFADALAYRGFAASMLGRHDEALSYYDKALQLTPDDTNLLNNRCNALLASRRFKDAISECEELLRLDASYKFVRGNLLYAKLQTCDWSSLPQDKAELTARLRAGLPVLQALQGAIVLASEADQQQCARIWMATTCPPSATPLWQGESYRHRRIRVAYVSENLRPHAVAFAIAGVFEHHDKSRFETIAIALGADDERPMRARLIRTFDRFIVAGDKSDLEIAKLMRDMQIDIAVDLTGFTENARSGIFAWRPAPIQVNYLGFPGTMGAPYIDYILVDKIIVPAASQPYYDEKLVHLPDSYLATDSTRRIAKPVSRAEAGLPEAGFVFCAFNNVAKLNPEIFDIWMRLLRAVEGSVLWLLAHDRAAVDNLKRAAQTRGVLPDRLVFAPFVEDAAEHLARLALADLFLDTLPYNAHSAGADALWAGVPIVSVIGSTFAGRVGASLLAAVGLPELVTQSLRDYEALARKLASEKDMLTALKVRLARNKGTHPLFDTARFTKNLEAAFLAMWERQQRGEAPASFAVGRPGAIAT